MVGVAFSKRALRGMEVVVLKSLGKWCEVIGGIAQSGQVVNMVRQLISFPMRVILVC